MSYLKTTDIVTKLRERTDCSTMLLCDPPRPAPDRLCHDAADEIELLRGRLKSLIEQCAYVRDSAEYVKHKKHHAVTHTMWSAFCKQIQAAKGNNI